MKPLTLLLIVCTLLALAAVATKPGDQECINELRSQYAAPGDGLQQLLGTIEINRATIRVEDEYFLNRSTPSPVRTLAVPLLGVCG